MAEENDKTERDEALNEDASTPETADEATDETPVAEAPAMKCGPPDAGGGRRPQAHGHV